MSEVIHASQKYVKKIARTIAAEEVAKIVANAPDDLDTLKEIADYIASDKTGAAQMVAKIDANAKAITKKVDAEEGKGLSTNDYTTEEKEKLSKAYTPDNLPPTPDLSGYAKKSDIPYALIEVPLADRINLTDRASTQVIIDDSVTDITFTLPEKTEGRARDFFLRLVITGEIPTLYFVEPNGENVSFDADDDSWAEIEQGVNILMFTDTGE